MNILLAVDGSDYTKRMLAYLAAHEELLASSAEFTALTVVPRVPPEVTQFIDQKTLASYYAEQAERVLHPIRRFAEQHGWKPKTCYETGHAAQVISGYAEQGRYDLVVLGSHGHAAFGSLVMGSVATAVVAHCKTPVLIVR